MSRGKHHAVSTIVVNGDKFLVTKRSQKVKSYKGFWNFPGGSVDRGETYLEAAVREVEEETGLTIFTDVLVYAGKLDLDGLDVTYFITDEFEGSVKINDESTEWKWISMSELNDLLFMQVPKEVFAKVSKFMDVE